MGRSLLDFSKEELAAWFKEAGARFRAERKVCPKCLGVGCADEDFGIGNGGKPCTECKGKGSVPRQQELF